MRGCSAIDKQIESRHVMSIMDRIRLEMSIPAEEENGNLLGNIQGI